VGNHGILGPGDVQWMTAGSGVVHSEMPEAGFLRSGGRMHGFQIWVNLPRKDKMVRPRYQDIPSARLPMPRSNDGRVAVKVIAGEALGENAVIETRIPITFLHLVLQSGGTIEIPIATGQTVFAYVIEGTGSAGLIDRTVREGQLVQFADDGDAVALRGPVGNESPASILLLAGSPLHEPVARYGPFVMNTPQEINQAIADYQNGTMGLIENP
jgi:redox-sensitive bicupin YhaK (pirin superfamily)